MNNELNSPKILHIESTDSCNAACPQCAREFDTSFDKNNLHHLTVNQIKELFLESDIKQLEKVYMCGNYGDPAAGKHSLEIYKYFRSINQNITLGMNTNGSIRSYNWWKSLALLMNQPKDYVVFSIDGLEDTNHIYRVNTVWKNIINNAKTFINNGGSAHWDMLIFEHNQHQIDECQKLAKELGFKWFRAKVSKRHDLVPIDFLKFPKNFSNPLVTNGTIKCQALDEKSIYVSAKGIKYPCCWLGLTDHTLETFSIVKESWKTNPIKQCQDACASTNHGSSFTNQWQYEINLN